MLSLRSLSPDAFTLFPSTKSAPSSVLLYFSSAEWALASTCAPIQRASERLSRCAAVSRSLRVRASRCGRRVCGKGSTRAQRWRLQEVAMTLVRFVVSVRPCEGEMVRYVMCMNFGKSSYSERSLYFLVLPLSRLGGSLSSARPAAAEAETTCGTMEAMKISFINPVDPFQSNCCNRIRSALAARAVIDFTLSNKWKALSYRCFDRAVVRGISTRTKGKFMLNQRSGGSASPFSRER